MITLEYAFSYGASIQEARRLDQEERSAYKPEYADKIFVGIGDHLKLDMINFDDTPDRKSDGFFNGCTNFAWIITEDERDTLVALNKKREREKTAKEIAQIERIVAKCEAQRDLPSRAEAERRMKRYNDINNDGGEGYVPHIYSLEEYEYYKKRLEALKSQEEAANDNTGF